MERANGVSGRQWVERSARPVRRTDRCPIRRIKTIENNKSKLLYLSSCSVDFSSFAGADRSLRELPELAFELAEELELPDESDSVDSESVSVLLLV